MRQLLQLPASSSDVLEYLHTNQVNSIQSEDDIHGMLFTSFFIRYDLWVKPIEDETGFHF